MSELRVERLFNRVMGAVGLSGAARNAVADDVRAILREALRARSEGAGWQPIETAPCPAGSREEETVCVAYISAAGLQNLRSGVPVIVYPMPGDPSHIALHRYIPAPPVTKEAR